MKSRRLLFALASLALAFASCNPNQYNFDNFQGVHADGEMYLPIAHGDYTVSDLMQRFEIDSLIDYDPSGNMSFNVFLEQMGIIKGEEMLRFDDVSSDEHFVFSFPWKGRALMSIDTVFNLRQTIRLESEDIRVLSATMKSGVFDFIASTNFGEIRKIDITSPEIKDAQGNEYEFVYDPQLGINGFDLAGLRYETNETNTLNFNYKVYVSIQNVVLPEYCFDFHVSGTDLALGEMRGYINPYDIRTRIDTAFSVFPDNMSGMMAVENAVVTLSERNTFGMGASLVIDTAMVWGDGIDPFFLLDPLPLEIEVRPATDFVEVFHQALDGRLDAQAGAIYLTSDLIVNPEGTMEQVSVTDASTIDMRVNVNVPFDFSIDDVHYTDTVNMRLSEIQSPEWIKKLTLELLFTSTVPFNLMGRFQMIDTEHNEITYTLLDDATLIAASYDGQPTVTEVTIEIDGVRMADVMRSDRIILDFGIDSDGRNIVLNADQGLRFYLKAKVEYDGVIEF